MQVFIILLADMINVEKIISKQISYLVCRSLESYNFFSKLYRSTCEMRVSVLVSMKEECKNRLGADIQYLTLSNINPRFRNSVEAKKICFQVLRHSFFIYAHFCLV